MTRMSPAEWRIMNDIVSVTGYPMPDNAAQLVADQQTEPATLYTLEDRQLIRAEVDGLAVFLREIAHGNANLRRVTIHPTARGVRTVTTDPTNRVIRWLIQGSPRKAAASYLRSKAGVGDAHLREMESDGLIQALGASGAKEVPMSTFKKLPPRLMIKLTPVGRRRWSYNGEKWWPGTSPAERRDGAVPD